MENIPEVYSHLDEYDYAKQLKEFLETKAGVKGVADSGAINIPRIFIHPPENRPKSTSYGTDTCPRVPIIDFEGLENGKRMEIVNEIREAATTWGFFQMVNHGVPLATMDKLLERVRQFHEQPQEVKEEWYSDDETRKIRLYSNGYFTASRAAYWKDTLIFLAAQQLEKEQVPQVCRDAVIEYTKCLMRFKETVSELLSEALGLSGDCLAKTECMNSVTLACHYYPACPQPELTWGISSHTDQDFITLLLQDDVGGLQVLHQDKWVDVPTIHGALILNFGDLMQLITNDKFKSAQHRVRVVPTNTRVSIASFFFPTFANQGKPFGPIKELLSEKDPPIYRETSLQEYITYMKSKGPNPSASLPHFKVSS
ncbi:1-aminocyclopropane-1-carboxylate oxidase homolog 6-like [Durio zibethinus]|uniref:1-aminocyclopropane-1-carboxylate oxidase homolog 6-like n=1 Tax=Durio zibethinus TaxID=66656 RepID=A0A6P6A051_DURZI|nr:1-aminocyclopropane-1-carboxylate oxidase homolog 6-like [Durio zibethinus]